MGLSPGYDLLTGMLSTQNRPFIKLIDESTVMDEADLAQEREEAIRNAALAARQQRLTSPDGRCIWCKDEPVVANTAFCSAECDEDYHKHQREIRRRGGRD